MPALIVLKKVVIQQRLPLSFFCGAHVALSPAVGAAIWMKARVLGLMLPAVSLRLVVVRRHELPARKLGMAAWGHMVNG